MADRNLNFDPTVTSVTPNMPDLGLETGAADFADKIAEVSANSKALNANAQTALAYRQLDTQYRESTAGNPNDPKALQELQAQRAQITSTIGQQVPAIAQREYMTGAIELQKSSDKMNELWGMHQQIRNADSDLSTAENTQLKIANQAGQQFGQDGADMGNLNSVMNFEQAQASIKQFATPVIGQPKVDDYLKNFSSNWVKSFVSGVAENSPQAAAAMLQRPEIAGHFTSQDVGDMADLIKRTQKQQELITNLQTTKNDGGLVDVVNDPNSSYLDKRLTIEKGMAAGNITPKAGKAAIGILHTQEDIDTQTDTPFMADIVNKTYDLNSNANSSADDYLNGVKALHQHILDGQAAGNITPRDASKVTREVNDLTGKKLADSTNTAGMEFYDANQKFTALPPEYRGQATRALFYAGSGQNWTPQQYSNQADQVIQQINTQRRVAAQRALNNAIPQSDSEFLKTVPNASPESIAATAKQYGISEQQVIMQLRAKAGAAARGKKNAVKAIKGGSDDDAASDVPSSAGSRPPAPSDSTADDAEMVQ